MTPVSEYLPAEPLLGIPLDIQLLIIDAVANTNPSSLKACAVTCRGWLSTARFHLYRSVALGGPSQLRVFLDAVASNPELGPLVQTLTFDGFIVSNDEIPGVEDLVLDSKRILCTLGNLKTLVCRGFYGSDDVAVLLVSLLSSVGSPNLTALVVDDSSLDDYTQLTSVLLSLPHLKSLQIKRSGCGPSHQHDESPQTLRQWPKLTQLEVRHYTHVVCAFRLRLHPC